MRRCLLPFVTSDVVVLSTVVSDHALCVVNRVSDRALCVVNSVSDRACCQAPNHVDPSPCILSDVAVNVLFAAPTRFSSVNVLHAVNNSGAWNS